MKRIKRLFKNKKGMSLVEIIVGSLMFAMVAMTVASMFAPFMMAFARANDIAEYNTLLDAVGNRIASDLVRSSAAPGSLGAVDHVVLTIDSPDDVTYTTDLSEGNIGGSLLRNGHAVFPPGFYKGKIATFVVNADPGSGGYIITVTVETSPNSNRFATSAAVVTRDFAVMPLMLVS